MRKKISLLLVVVLGVILTLTMVACNKSSQDPDKLPGSVKPSDVVSGDDSGEVETYLTFTFPTQMSSVFKSLYIDEFDISSVKYCVNYSRNGVVTEGEKNSLTEDMIDDDSKPLLQTAGHHMIHVTYTMVDGSTAKGSFALHLMDKYNPTEKVSVTFDLRDGDTGNNATAYFGTTSAQGTTATVELDKGINFKTWDDFVNTFSLSLDKKALASVTIANKTYSSTQGFGSSGLTFNSSVTVKTVWTDNTYNVNFTLGVPADATLIAGTTAPEATFTKVVERGTKVSSPKVDSLNVYNGYSFAGWYVDNGSTTGVWDEQDTLWNFSKSVQNDLSLVARWTKRAYSFTIYTMGANFKSTVANSTVGNVELKDADSVKSAGLTLVDGTSRFSLESGQLQRIVMSGFGYGHNYNEYAIKVQTEPSNTSGAKVVYLTFQDLLNSLEKGGDYVKLDAVYSDYQCQNKANITTVTANADGSDGIGYLKWVFNTSTDENENLTRLSNYYTNVLFKNGLTVKADGSVRIDKVADESVNEIIIPAEIVYDGATRPVTEISAQACMNLKALVKLDLSGAENLTKIGQEAFKHCPHLRDVSLPTSGAIEEIGKQIFADTAFENNYLDGGNNAIILGTVLYKYVGKNVEALDLSTDEYSNVTRIADGAFVDCTALRTIAFGNKLNRIDNGAFENLTSLVNLNNVNNLTYVGENAFANSGILTNASNCYKDTIGAIVIGNIYYRFIDTQKSVATINGADTCYIAPSAFMNCSHVEQINVYEESKILSIGKGAFSGTRWLRNTTDQFIVYNGILCEYPGNKDLSNITLPTSPASITIIEDAFYTSAQSVRTVKFGTNITAIEDYAFRGMNIAESFIFSDIKVNAEGNALVGAPRIAQNAFANSAGELVGNAKFYFSDEVIAFFDKINSGASTTDDEVTMSWLSFYNLHKANFVVEHIESVRIDQSLVPNKLLNYNNGKNALENLYASGKIENALIVRGNTGVERRETLDFEENNVQFVQVVAGDEKYGALYESGVNKYVVTFTYLDCQGEYVVTLTNAVKGLEYFNTSTHYSKDGAVHDLTSVTSGNYYIDGFKQKEGATIPTFYTSFDNANFTFSYVDVFGTPQSKPVTVIGFSTNNAKSNATAQFKVDFDGIGTYVFTMKYNVEEAKVIDFEQVGAISIPLNSNASEAMRKFYAYLIGEDGNKEMVALSSANGFSVQSGEAIDTATLGMHTITARYMSNKTEKEIVKDIVYSVVLEADASLFGYEIVSQKPVELNGTKYVGTARITSCSATRANTIVLPTSYTDNSGNVYAVTQIGKNASSKGVFEGFTSLKAIYLGANITYINARSFANCTLLENVYTVQHVAVDKAQLTEKNWSELSSTTEQDAIIHNVRIENLADVQAVEFDGRNVIAIASQYEQLIGGRKHIYNVVEMSNVKIDVDNVEVFLPDTLQNSVTLVGKDNSVITPNMYSSQSDAMFRTTTSVAKGIASIGTSAFENCQSLKSIDLSKAKSLDYIGARAFAGTGLESIDLSQNTSLVSLEISTFEGCASLASATLSANVTTLGGYAFKNCTSLTTLTATGLTNVADSAFDGCDNLVR